ncbi:MAG TPA: SDR family oxidoreductase [Pyrinomonadaceae bacterium]|jgi:NAD(P)-dependent dehydrogenase (short-subunit alcohol dehydrogenase family)|nr:SDR family oxidoreductase [Pyrinomonadaceae bacterium]
MKRPVLILGATSAIARGAASAFAARGHALYLAGRDREELERIAADLRLRHHAEVLHGHFDAEDYAGHGAFVERVREETGGLHGVLLAFGYLAGRADARGAEEGAATIARNLTGAVSVLEHCAAVLESQDSGGFIIGVSSVAGDRGRQSNYLYGAAKGGLSVYLQGLRNRLHPAGVRVLTVKPGFVDTRMTYGMPGLFLVARPASVGEAIVRALERGRDVVYVPWFWRYVMLAVKLIPEPVFKRLKL